MKLIFVILSFLLILNSAVGSNKRFQVANKTFQFETIDKSIGFGSYNGPISTLYSIENNKRVVVNSIDERGHKRPIELMKSLKTNWKIKENGKNGFPELLKVRCRPDFAASSEDETKFKVTYSRFLYDGTQWKRKDRELAGFWEDEGVFPSENLFP